MLQAHDIRHTRVWQEAKGEGMQEGEAKERRETISKLAAKSMTAQEIATLLDLDVMEVQRVLDERGAK